MAGAVAAAAFLLLLVLLLLESGSLRRSRRRVPVRVAVTGVRGKSSTVRLLAAALREGGRRVVAKTTGSRPRLILPDGEERSVRRSGIASILEQKRLLRTAGEAGADVLVTELMSIAPENLEVEACRILQPGLLLVTAIRVDHQPQLGYSLEQVSRGLTAAFPRNGEVLSLEHEHGHLFQAAAGKRGARLAWVPADAFPEAEELARKLPYAEFPENVRLALAAAACLGVGTEAALRGMRRVLADPGCLRAWRRPAASRPGGPVPGGPLLVNAFAANEPDSTVRILERVQASFADGCPPGPWVGVFNLRADRGERTVQFLEACRQDRLRQLDRIALVGSGLHAAAARRVLRRKVPVLVIRERRPERIMARLDAWAPDAAVLFGFGNYGGTGEALVDIWAEQGTLHEL